MKNNFDYLNIKNIFLFLTGYFVLIPFIFNLKLSSLLTVLVVTIGVGSFLLGYRTRKYFKIVSRNENRISTLIIFMLGTYFLISDYISGYYNVFSIRDMVNYGALYEVKDATSLYIQIVYLIIYAVKYYIYALLMSKNKFLFYFIFLSQILILFNSPTRLVALSPFIIFLTYGYYLNYIKINLLRIIVLILMMPIIFVVLLLSRGGTQGLNYFEIVSNVLNSLTIESFIKMLKIALESFKSFDDLVGIVTTNFVHIESGIIRIFFMPISRNIWDEKPEPAARMIAKYFSPENYAGNGGTVATIYGDAFLNAHILGVVFILYCLGYISRVIYNTRKKNTLISTEQKSIITMFYSLYFFQFIYYMRGFLSDSLWKIILISCIFTLLYILHYKIIRKNEK